MDTLKKKPGRKSRAAIVAEALDIALPKLPKAEGEAAPEPMVAQMPAPSSPLFVVAVPEWLHNSAVPLNEQCPADVRMAIEAEIGCVVRLDGGAVHAADGRVFRAEMRDGVIEVFGA